MFKPHSPKTHINSSSYAKSAEILVNPRTLLFNQNKNLMALLFNLNKSEGP